MEKIISIIAKASIKISLKIKTIFIIILSLIICLNCMSCTYEPIIKSNDSESTHTRNQTNSKTSGEDSGGLLDDDEI